MWPKQSALTPAYQIEAVASMGDQVFVILRAPYGIYTRLFDPLRRPGFTAAARDWGADTPEVHFVWSGTIEEGELRLDVPNSMIESLGLQAHYLRTKKR